MYSPPKIIRRARRPLNGRRYARKLFRRQKKSVYASKSWRKRRTPNYRRKCNKSLVRSRKRPKKPPKKTPQNLRAGLHDKIISMRVRRGCL